MEKYYEENYLNCSSAALESRFKCGRYPTPQYLVGLKVPIVECTFGKHEENYTKVWEEQKKGYLFSKVVWLPFTSDI